MKVVIKIGGSMVFDENGPKMSYLKNIVPIIKNLKKKNQVIISIGGGKYGRKYIKNLKGFLPNDKIEWVFIDLLKANARLLGYLLNMKPIFSLKDIKSNTSGVISGIVPGRSTDANALLCAQKIKADIFIKLTDIDGIYTKDPDKYKDAKKLEKIKFDDIEKYKTKTSPGSYGILDPTAMKIIKNNRITSYVISGNDPKNILKVMKGENVGTKIGN
jgi:uridylate kinase